jgi:hypothetical protein
MVSAIRMVAERFWQDHSWLKALEGFEAQKGQETWEKPRRKLSPHALFSECPRATQLQLLGYRPPRDASAVRRMENGTYTHQRYAAILKELGIGEEPQTIENEWLRGTPDFIVRSGGGEFIVELKTINSAGFKKLPKPTVDGKENLKNLFKVQPAHVIQWLAYDALLRDNGRDIGRGYVVYENKDTQARTAIFIVRDSEFFAKHTVLAREALELLKRGVLVDPPFPANSDVCSRCYVSKACRRIEAGDVYLAPRALKALREFLTLDESTDRQEVVDDIPD